MSASICRLLICRGRNVPICSRRSTATGLPQSVLISMRSKDTLGQLTGRAHVAALSSGTAGLHLALLLAGVTSGDEVLVSTFTFVATANAVLQCGAMPVFVDSSAADWNIDPDLVAEELAERAKHGRLPAAVVAVDLYGQCADYDRLEPDLCRVRGSTDCRFGRIAWCISGRKARWVARACWRRCRSTATRSSLPAAGERWLLMTRAH